MNDAVKMNQAQIIKAFSALGCACSPRRVDGITGARYSVLVSMRNARTGTGWTDEVSEGEVDVASIAKQIAAKLKIQIRRADIASAVSRATEES